MEIRRYLNKVILLLTASDIFTWGPISMVTPLIGIFLSERFGQKTIFYVGMGTALYFLSRAIFQIPIGLISDKIKHDSDEIGILVMGCFLMGLMYMLIPFVREPWEYFVLMVLEGLGASMNLNSWRKLFAANVDKNHSGIGYGFYETVMSLSTAVISIIGGYYSSLSNDVFAIVLVVIGFTIIIGGIISGVIITIRTRKSVNI